MRGYLIDDFGRELHDFIIDPKMERDQEKATRQCEAFRHRFPLQELQKMPLEEFRDPRGGKDDFCHWITDGTSAVTNRLAWAKVKLGISGSRNYGYQRNLRMAADWHERGRDSWLSLAHFLSHYGLRSNGRVEHDFGQPLLLKLLYLYHPEDFINIASVGWIDKIVYIPIPKEILECVEFMTGPCVPKKLRPIVEDKIKSILPSSTIVSNSKYTDNLKFK